MKKGKTGRMEVGRKISIPPSFHPSNLPNRNDEPLKYLADPAPDDGAN
jgi:hypothetical protein